MSGGPSRAAPTAYAAEVAGEDLVSRACPLVNELGSAFYFEPATLDRGRELGLDGFRFYFLGRGGVLGDVEAPVVESAFGYFEPGLLARMWNSGRERCAPRQAGRHFVECCRDYGRRTFGAVAGLDAFCAAAGRVVAAAPVAGRSLFAGWRAEPLADDPPARAMQLVAVLRELRGSAHLLAVVAVGLEPRLAHLARRPEMAETFGWPAGSVTEVTDEHRARLAEAEALTDRLVRPAFGSLDDRAGAELVAGLDAMAAARRA